MLKLVCQFINLKSSVKSIIVLIIILFVFLLFVVVKCRNNGLIEKGNSLNENIKQHNDLKYEKQINEHKKAIDSILYIMDSTKFANGSKSNRQLQRDIDSIFNGR